MELLSQEEEQALHDKGEEMRRETDWVFDVMRLRTSRVREARRRVGGEGTSLRPRRNVKTARYQE